MKLAVVGSRNFNKSNFAFAKIDELRKKYPSINTIVSGCARGADQIGLDYAEQNNLETMRFPADWDRFGKAAGMIRNSDIVKNADILIAFWNMMSPGTRDSINKAKKKKIPVIIVDTREIPIEYFMIK